MKLQFEEWILSQDIPIQSKESIKEAIICYKASAYRSSLLFSYICFLLIIRDRLLYTHRPSNITEEMWGVYNNELRQDDKWDSKVFDLIMMNRNGKDIFFISDDLRNQVKYWRDRRNDCAHLKSNDINYWHVEAFWSFLQCNLAKFKVNGSKQALLERIGNKFDIRITRPDTDFSEIINEITFSVNESEFPDFIKQIHDILCEHIGEEYYYEAVPATMFWQKLFSVENANFINSLVQFFKTEDDLFINLIDHYPFLINYFSKETSFIRLIWYEKLYRTWSINEIKIFASLLRNRLIPDEEIDEAIDRFIKKGSFLEDIIDESDYEAIKKNGFFEKLKKYVFETIDMNNFDLANKKSNLIVFALTYCDIDEIIVKNLTSTFSSASYPFRLANFIESFFKRNNKKREEFLSVSTSLELRLPKNLGFS